MFLSGDHSPWRAPPRVSFSGTRVHQKPCTPHTPPLLNRECLTKDKEKEITFFCNIVRKKCKPFSQYKHRLLQYKLHFDKLKGCSRSPSPILFKLFWLASASTLTKMMQKTPRRVQVEQEDSTTSSS
ncbi:hypothetical protein PIB30_116845 [Stylosanthes scabra]|uniref:Uncharacterized protein n=1 Tax=Stylosanthes scabra TaxID=79078 RepID=A0ABU6ZBA3_9FABA|nr:hypothetical protein [Stylosanthes scabra]